MRSFRSARPRLGGRAWNPDRPRSRPYRPPGAPGQAHWYIPPVLRITPQGYALGVIPLIKNLIQLAAVPEVNGAGIMFSGCGLWVTLIYLPTIRPMSLKHNNIIEILGRRPSVGRVIPPDGDTLS